MKIARSFQTEFKSGELATVKAVTKTTLGNILPNSQKSVRTAVRGAQAFCETEKLGLLVPEYGSDGKLLGWHWATKGSKEFWARYRARRHRREFQAVGLRVRCENAIAARKLSDVRELEEVRKQEFDSYVESNPQAKAYFESLEKVN